MTVNQLGRLCIYYVSSLNHLFFILIHHLPVLYASLQIDIKHINWPVREEEGTASSSLTGQLMSGLMRKLV